jgi:hypothetical protein
MKLVEEAGHFSRSYIIFAYLCLSLLCEQTPIGLTPLRDAKGSLFVMQDAPFLWTFLQ